jgi:hypothetical protein
MISIDLDELDEVGLGPAPLAYLSLAILCASLGVTIESVEDDLYSESLVFHHLPTDNTLAVISNIDGLSATILLTVVRRVGNQLAGEPNADFDDEDLDDDDWAG